jgi:hypothetical protein
MKAAMKTSQRRPEAEKEPIIKKDEAIVKRSAQKALDAMARVIIYELFPHLLPCILLTLCSPQATIAVCFQ